MYYKLTILHHLQVVKFWKKKKTLNSNFLQLSFPEIHLLVLKRKLSIHFPSWILNALIWYNNNIVIVYLYCWRKEDPPWAEEGWISWKERLRWFKFWCFKYHVRPTHSHTRITSFPHLSTFFDENRKLKKMWKSGKAGQQRRERRLNMFTRKSSKLGEHFTH